MIVRFFTWKRLKKIYDAKLIFWSFATFFVLTIFWSGAKQRFCFRESMSVLDQNGIIHALGFLARWRLSSHALYYKIPYCLYYLVRPIDHHYISCLCTLLYLTTKLISIAQKMKKKSNYPSNWPRISKCITWQKKSVQPYWVAGRVSQRTAEVKSKCHRFLRSRPEHSVA